MYIIDPYTYYFRSYNREYPKCGLVDVEVHKGSYLSAQGKALKCTVTREGVTVHTID